MKDRPEKIILTATTISVAFAGMLAATIQPLRAQATHASQDSAQTPPAFDEKARADSPAT
jgi:hypothetical protein